jgi:hypothetical protein
VILFAGIALVSAGVILVILMYFLYYLPAARVLLSDRLAADTSPFPPAITHSWSILESRLTISS